MSPEAAFCGERATTQLTRERPLAQVCSLVQTQSSGAAEDTQTYSTLVSSLGSRQRRSSCFSCRDSLAGHQSRSTGIGAEAKGSQHFPAIGTGGGGQVMAMCIPISFSRGL